MESSSSLSKTWLRQQRHLREELINARGTSDRPQLRSLVARALSYYESYYQARSDATRADPVRAFSAPWATSLERAVYWISGWRPNTIVHILYSESGIRFEAQLPHLLLGVHSGDLGDLTPDQLARIDDLQRRTIGEEDEIEQELADLQEGVADPFPPSDSDLDAKVGRVESIIVKADDLRMRTLRAVIEILDPLQAVDLLVAAADLEIGSRKLGLEIERGRVNF